MQSSFVIRHSSLAWRPRRAFTLVEVLVAATITALLAGFIAVIVRNVSIVWSRAGNRLGADAQARLVLDQLQLDLQGAHYRDDGNVWFAADVLNAANGGATGLWQIAARNAKPNTNLSLQMNPPKLSDARFGTAGVWLRFFTTSRGANTAALPATISAPVAVGYQIIRRFTATNPANLNTAYLLHRSETRPAATTAAANSRPGVLEAGYNITSANYTTSTSSTNSGAITGDPRSIQVPGSVRNLDSVITDNVIDFGVRAYVRDLAVPGGLRLIFPATANGGLSNVANARLRGSLPQNTPVNQWGGAQPFPDVVDVMVRILTDEGAAQIANIEKVQTPALVVPQKYNSNAQEWWWGIAQENSRVYTRRIVINAKSL
ncbi:MAG: prepilin-type N-terminal cleavage/methylation domain-containing protein [Opitutus sp.]|nr:prepilin-type N-terminal cleavage/methylation domain-containing protein [Opitutus sp.]